MDNINWQWKAIIYRRAGGGGGGGDPVGHYNYVGDLAQLPTIDKYLPH